VARGKWNGSAALGLTAVASLLEVEDSWGCGPDWAEQRGGLTCWEKVNGFAAAGENRSRRKDWLPKW
jgi:hypothetical protein